MTETCPSVESPTWLRFNQLLLAALPVRDLRELLKHLALFWQELTAAQLVFVSAVLPSKKELWGGIAGMERPAENLQFDDDSAHWEQEAVCKLLSRHAGVDRQIDNLSPHGIAFNNVASGDGDSNSGTPAKAGVILFSTSNDPQQSGLLPMMVECSNKLIAQGLLSDNSPVETQTRREFEEAKLRSLAEFAAGAGHEIHNPVATISGRVQLLMKDEIDPSRRRALATIGGQAIRIRDMIGDLRLFARPPQPELAPINLTQAVRSVLQSLDDKSQKTGGTIQFSTDEPVAIWADHAQVCIVISNLILNSLKAISGNGTIHISAKTITEPYERCGVLTVSDDGSGLTETDREHLFDPFYSGRQAGRGLGFGLSKCWRIVDNHGGRIDVDSVPGKRTTFTVFWPSEAGVGKNTV